MNSPNKIGIFALSSCLFPCFAQGQVNYNSIDTFDVSPPLSATQAPGAWYPDRYRPAAFDSFDLSGENVLRVGIDAIADGSAGRGGQSGGFYNTQGRKYDLPAGTFALKSSLYVPSTWLGIGDRRRSDLWATATDGAGGITGYPIIGMANVDDTPVIRYWSDAGWVVTSIPVTGDTWYEFEMELEGDTLTYRVNGAVAGTVEFPGSIQFRDTIFQAYNFNDPTLAPGLQSAVSYEAYWDNFGIASSIIKNTTLNATYDTLQEAINAANPNDSITIEGNINLTSVVTIDKPLTIDGIDKATTKISGSNALASHFFLLVGSSAGSTIQNISFDKIDKAGPQNMIGLQTANVTFQNCDFTGRYVLGDGDVSRAFEISSGANDFLIDGCSVVGLRQPGYINAVTSGTVQNGYVAGTRGWVVDGGLVTFTGNSWGSGPNANAVDIALLASTPYSSLYDPLSTLIANNNGATISNQRAGILVVNTTLGAGYATIQAAIDAASNGDAIEVYPGTFTGNLNINKDVTIEGPNAGINAVTGTRGAEATIVGRVTIGSDGVTLDGLSLTNPSGTIGIYSNNYGDLAITNNVISGVNTGSAGSADGIYINANTAAVSNFLIANNKIANIGSASATVSVKGIYFGDSTGPNVVSNIVIDGNEITAVEVGTKGAYGITLNHGSNGAGSVSGLQITNNTISGLTGKWVHAIGLETETGAATITGNEISNLVLNANAAPGSVDAVGVFFEKNPVGGPLSDISKNIFRNSMPLGVAVHPDDTYTVNASENFWDSADGPTGVFGSAAVGSGTPAPAGVDYSPWYAEEGMINLVSLANFTNLTIPKGTTQTESGDFYIGAGSTVTVRGSLIVGGSLLLQQGATLIVIDGQLEMGDGTVISGSFTIFNSLGSWDINGDTTFNVSQSLALVTDIHVAAGATITVNGGGELILDGCVIDSQTTGSTFNVDVESDGLLTIARSTVSDAIIDINTDTGLVTANFTSKVYDNTFSDSVIEAKAGSYVYHNLIDATSLAASNTETTTAFDPIDGWSNVTDAMSLQNRYTLDLVLDSGVPATRTTGGDGSIYVQSNDLFDVELNVSNLGGNTIVSAESLIGYNSDLIQLVSTIPSAVTPEADWQVVFETENTVSSLGLIDSALGLQYNMATPDGTNADGTIAKIHYRADDEGVTYGFFRVQTNGQFDGNGVLLKDTRLTKSVSGVPSYLSAYTANTSQIVIDDQAPTIDGGATGTQVQASAVSNPVDVFDTGSNFALRNGNVVTITFTASDAGDAGLDAADKDNDLVLTAANGTTTLNSSDYTSTATEDPLTGIVTYVVSLTVPVTATTGNYAVTGTVLDRSGNQSALASIGNFIVANEAFVTVELEGFTGGTRDVTFVATGGTNQSWTKSVVFSGTTGTVTLENVPAGTSAISAKTAWNLRSKVTATFSPEGYGTASHTGVDKLLGGDINGDNLVNTFDYSILRFNWLSTNPVADIDGSGGVNGPDYNLLRANFYTLGDAE